MNYRANEEPNSPTLPFLRVPELESCRRPASIKDVIKAGQEIFLKKYEKNHAKPPFRPSI
jgi:hypothetical protein